MCNPGLGPWTDSETFCCQVDISLRFAITDFIYSGDSNDHLTSVPTVSPLSRHIYYLMQQFLLLIILITKKIAWRLAGKYQMRFLPANTFCKIVKQFSFTDRANI